MGDGSPKSRLDRWLDEHTSLDDPMPRRKLPPSTGGTGLLELPRVLSGEAFLANHTIEPLKRDVGKCFGWEATRLSAPGTEYRVFAKILAGTSADIPTVSMRTVSELLVFMLTVQSVTRLTAHQLLGQIGFRKVTHMWRGFVTESPLSVVIKDFDY